VEQLDYVLDGTYLRYRHTSMAAEDERDLQLDSCRRHTAFYYHSLGEYLRHFAGRDAAYVAVDGPEASGAPGTFERVCEALGAGTAAPDARARLAGPEPIDGVVDYRTPEFLGVRTAPALYRFYGRDAFGWPVGVAHHLFEGGAGEDRQRVPGARADDGGAGEARQEEDRGGADPVRRPRPGSTRRLR
jgi:hypothetical protein